MYRIYARGWGAASEGVYGVFVAAFLVARTLIGNRPLSQAEALANALDLVARLPEGPLDPDDRARIRLLLDRADPQAARTKLAAGYLAQLPTNQDDDSPLVNAERGLARAYATVMARPWMKRAEPTATGPPR